MDGEGAPDAGAREGRRAPRLVRGAGRRAASVTRIDSGNGRGPGCTGELVLAADAGDEIDEIWDEAAMLALGGRAIALAGFRLVSSSWSRALAAVAALCRRRSSGSTRRSLRAGRRAVAPEFVAIGGAR